ncbi:hypothetical protein WA1_43315 [Scytonema hofmannii PCC 7110]|uniref:Uncharacterized protein n=1 Tax=Scytonema hofmannii PCC 7110 TaxID=128403 RepID=A0A139WVS3_9CYAN|nr:hypothetical protein WA1_43315 [Scytonema hofmannii PCC 7110]
MRILDFGFWILDFGFWILDWGLGIGNRMSLFFIAHLVKIPCLLKSSGIPLSLTTSPKSLIQILQAFSLLRLLLALGNLPQVK